MPLALVGYMYSILSRDIDNDFVLISTECDAFEEERMQLRKENDALLKGIQSLHGLLAQKEEHIELARYIIQKLRGQAKGACRALHSLSFLKLHPHILTPDLQKPQKTSNFQPRRIQTQACCTTF